MNRLELNNFEIGGDKLTVFAGPCAIEDEQMLFEVAGALKAMAERLDVNFVFKASYDKANRSSISSYRGPGLEKGLELLAAVKEKYALPVLTDIHLPEEAARVAKVADILQIPAFLCRQTDMLVAAGQTGKIINIKKGQFLAPEQIKGLARKIESTGNGKILVTERGTTFGYNNLVVDMRAIKIIQDLGYGVVFDATHSVQLPGCGADGGSTGGDRRFVPLLARSAVAAGAKALFFEVHPNPSKAKCDGDNMLPLSEFETVLENCKNIFEVVNK
jgi:2-dehydro-3-deoxyphosphooctonate aldolase (KDO 8-P synthase)